MKKYMKKYMKNIGFLALILISLTSCLKSGLNNGEGEKKDDSFDFSTTKQSAVNLDLGLRDYSILIELYYENPVEEAIETVDGVEYSSFVKKEEVIPVLKAITDYKGKLADVVNLPKGTKVVYLYTEYIGFPIVTPITLKDGNVNFIANATSQKSNTRAVTKANNTHKYPDDMAILGEWNDNGIPEYILPTNSVYPSDLLYDLKKAVSYNVNSGFVGWEYLDEKHYTNLDVTKSTDITISFLGGVASMFSTLCYYHYPTNKKPENESEVKLIMAFPNAAFPLKDRGGLSSGHSIKLKYWNSETNAFEENFPEGVTVSFALIPNSFKSNGNVIMSNSSSERIFFSQSELNTKENNDTRRHCILLKSSKSEYLTLLFEDRPRRNNVIEGFYPGGNFEDVMFYIKGSVPGAINTANIVDMPNAGQMGPDETDNVTTAYGTLIFEDLWPSEGDYDMNDVIIEYTSRTHRNKWNRVVQIIDEFKVVHKGGVFNTAFGYQLDTYEGQITSCVTEPAISGYDFSMTAKGLEARQNKPTVIVFSDISTSIGKTTTVTTVFASPQEYSKLAAPYNPFIVNLSTGRGAEIHLTNQPPTALMNKELFGTGQDISDENKGKYYLSKNGNFPFAMVLPLVRDFTYAKEGIRIDIQYPDFAEWVSSKGENCAEWYK